MKNASNSATSSRPPHAPQPRTPRLGFAGVPKSWFGGSVAATQVANGVNLLFPAGERFFVRSVKYYVDRLDDPELVKQVRGFFGQEGRHAQAHERFFDTMREQGYEIDELLAEYEKLAFGKLEKFVPARVRLSITVALEHFTAILAEDALAGGDLDGANPIMRQLLEWHALEELEHKAVAFDVLRAVHPSYALRIGGLALATTMLAAFWITATKELLAQDGMTLREAGRELETLREEAARVGAKAAAKPIFSRVFLRGIREYLRPSFHPNDKDHRAIFEETLARLTKQGVIDGTRAETEEAA